MADVVDARGLSCPQPVMLVLQKYKTNQPGRIDRPGGHGHLQGKRHPGGGRPRLEPEFFGRGGRGGLSSYPDKVSCNKVSCNIDAEPSQT